MSTIALGTEDELSEAVGVRLLTDLGLAVGHRFRKHGFGRLKVKMPSFCEMAVRQPVVVLTDLDTAACPSLLIQDWLNNKPRPDGLIFRVAIREVESWLLADHAGLHVLFGKSKGLNLPKLPDAEKKAKDTLIKLAGRYAPRDVRLDIVPEKGTGARQGLAYNDRLCPWVREVWNPREARERSPSLARTMKRLEELAGSLGA